MKRKQGSILRTSFVDVIANGRDSDLDWMQTGFISEVLVIFKLDSGSQVDNVPEYIVNEKDTG